jgi:hypothetical protein
LNGITTCSAPGTIPTTVAYTTPFEFDGERCISSVITLYTPAFLTVFAVRIALLPLLCWFQRRHPGWATPGLLGDTEAPPAGAEGSSSAAPRAAIDRENLAALNRLREQIETNTFGLNTIAVGLCTGLASPVVALAAFLCLAARHATVSAFRAGHRHRQRQPNGRASEAVAMAMTLLAPTSAAADASRARAGGGNPPPGTPLTEKLLGEHHAGSDTDTDTDTDHIGGDSWGQSAPRGVGSGDDEDQAPLPVTCIGLLLLLHSVYIALFLYSGGLGWRGPLAVILVNWIGFGVVCRRGAPL